VTLVAAALALAGCAGATGAPDTPQADSDACRAALARSPATVLGQGRAVDPAPGARAWGDQAVIAWCGITEPGPSSRPCLVVDGVAWLLVADGDPARFDSYGRSPAMEVAVTSGSDRSAATAALVDLAPVAAALPATGRACHS